MTDFIFNPRINYPFVITNGNEGTILISGISIPEEPANFFMPIQTWIDDFLTNQSDSLSVVFDMIFYNQTTSKYIYKMLLSLKAFYDRGKHINIKWHYQSEDIDIKEDGEDLREVLDIPFELIEDKTPAFFNIKKTDKSPLVYFDQMGDIVIEGSLMGAKPWEYFYPLIKWVDGVRFNSLPSNLKIELFIHDVDDINQHYLRHILHQLKLIKAKDNKSVTITWKYNCEHIQNIGTHLLNSYGLNCTFVELL